MVASDMRRVLSNRNVLVISLTQSITMFFSMLYMPYWALFLQEEIDMSLTQIGLLSALQRTEQLLFTLPGGLLADRIGRKKVTLIGAAAGMISPVIYLVSRSWELVLLATIISAFQSISMAAYDAMIAESLPRNQMGSGYGVLGMMRRIPMLFTGITGGFLMSALGLGLGTRICFAGVFIGAVVVFVSRYLFLTETLTTSGRPRTTFVHDFREVLPLFKGSLQAMQVSSAIYQFSAGLTMQLVIVYVIRVIGLSYTEWGVISTLMSVIMFATSIPGGIMADKFDRVKLNVLARAIAPATTIGYIYLRDFYQILAVRMVAGVGMGLSGAEIGWLGGPTWSSLMADLVPPEMRGRVNGVMSTVSGVVSFPAPYVGAWLWENPGFGPENTMWLSIGLGAISTAAFGLYVKDPRFQKQDLKDGQQP